MDATLKGGSYGHLFLFGPGRPRGYTNLSIRLVTSVGVSLFNCNISPSDLERLFHTLENSLFSSFSVFSGRPGAQGGTSVLPSYDREPKGLASVFLTPQSYIPLHT